MGRDLYGYLNDWGKPTAPASEVDNAGTDGGRYNANLPGARSSGAYALGIERGSFRGAYGQDAERTDGAKGGMSVKEVAQGYSLPGDGDACSPGEASWPQSIPPKSSDTQDPTIRYLLERHASGDTGAYTGEGNARSRPGGKQIGVGDPYSSGGNKL